MAAMNSTAAGLGTAGLGTAGLGTAGLGTAGLGAGVLGAGAPTAKAGDPLTVAIAAQTAAIDQPLTERGGKLTGR
jgi:hypothetical protein